MKNRVGILIREFAPAILLIVCCISFFALSFFSYGKVERMASAMVEKGTPVIILDAGHGGEDGGAQSSSGILEKDINLSIALKLADLFRSSGYTVVMTRETDISIGDQNLSTIRERKVSDLHNRLKMVEDEENCLLISIHQNHFSEAQYYGTQIFYSTKAEESEWIAERIRENVVSLLQPENKRQCKPATDSIYLLWNCTKPSVLVECGFLSNGGEAEKLVDETYQQQMAFAIYRGVSDYLFNPGE